MKRVITSVLVCLLLLASIQVSSADVKMSFPNESCYWTMFGGSAENDGSIIASCAPKTNACEKVWEYQTGDMTIAQPIINEINLYVGSFDHKLYCINADTGELDWRYDTTDVIKCTPAYKNGYVYFGSLDGGFYCLDADTGELEWDYHTKWNGGISSSPTIEGNNVFFGTLDGSMLCLDGYSGEVKWEYLTHDSISSCPVVADGMVYFGTRDFKFYCLDIYSGEVIWEKRLDGNIYASASYSDNFIYIGCDGNKFYCFEATEGEEIWTFETDNIIRSTPTISKTNVYFGSGYDFYCLDKEKGELIWQYSQEKYGVSTSALAGDRIYTSLGTSLYCFESNTGIMIWSHELNHDAYTPAIANGIIYVATKNGKIHAFRDVADPPFRVNPSIVNLGEIPPASTVSGVISILNQTDEATEYTIETDSDWFELSIDSIFVESKQNGQITITVNQDKMIEDMHWYMGRLIVKGGGLEYPVIVKIKTDSTLFLEEDLPVFNTAKCSWVCKGGVPEQTFSGTNECGCESDTLAKIWEEDYGRPIIYPPLVKLNRVFITPGYSNKLVCTSLDMGETIWEVELDGFTSECPCLSATQVLIPASEKLLCMAQTDGGLLWTHEVEGEIVTPATALNGKVFFGTSDGWLKCVDEIDGSLVWSYSMTTELTTHIAVSSSYVVAGSEDGVMHCLDFATGQKLWLFDTGETIEAGAAIVGEDVYFGTMNKRLYCYNAPTGEVNWFVNTSADVPFPPVVYQDRICVTPDDLSIRCYTRADGELVWEKNIDEKVETGLTYSNGRLYYGSWDGILYIMDADTGINLWSFESDGRIRAPISVTGKKLFLPSDRKVMAFGDPPPDILIVPEIIDYGQISVEGKGSSAYREITLKNTTENPIELTFEAEEGVEWFRPVVNEATLEVDGKLVIPVVGYFGKTSAGMNVANLLISWQEVTVPIPVRVYVSSDTSIMAQAWISFGRDQMRHSSVPGAFGPTTDKLRLRWSSDMGGETDCSPVVYKEKILIGSGNTFYAIDWNTSDTIWHKTFECEGFSSAGACTGVNSDMVIVGSEDGNVYSMSMNDGEKLWSFDAGGPVFSSPAIHEKRFDKNEPVQRRVYFGSLDNHVYSVLADTGELVWKFKTGGDVYASPAIPPEGDQIFIASIDDHVYSIDSMTGKERWSFKTEGSVYSTPTCFVMKGPGGTSNVAYECNLYVGSNDGKLYCLDGNTGKKLWDFDTGAAIVASPSLSYGKVFVGNTEGDFFILNMHTGDMIRKVNLGAQIRSSASICGLNCYITTKGGFFYSLDVDTLDVHWFYKMSSGSKHFQSSPAVLNSCVYVADKAGKLYCFEEYPPDLKFNTETIDFGTIEPSEVVNLKLTITNNTEDRDIHVTIQNDYDWFETDVSELTIEQDSSTEVRFKTIGSKVSKKGTYYAGAWIRWTSLDEDGEEVEKSQRITVVAIVEE
ncbi:MAG TPA: PQQ-binding-like beta-propeller repeat protein [Caldisericia bacterium]|nr:PQQ-binding-like beta-propeller repeat protein [Caldisericia bacterium]HPF48433.1 PQQ-binding-like beta-propeller repeat protein [Caldisericia bacterium]HPI83387.1 PQQ-binding-like beta-propeller repeat protein [Caldisericia bacterium]HPQ92887.1 PQQ-binding-like beta-propeller repeat protein [Caldisericia bacterium]HRV74015.1 PQQ-binding-like beta-propeller repeat protein [Caldisericia bacterium]